MNTLSTSVKREVSRLTRSGDPLAATALIQSALSEAVVCDVTSGASGLPSLETVTGNRSSTAPEEESKAALVPELNLSNIGAPGQENSAKAENDLQGSLAQRLASSQPSMEKLTTHSASTFIDGLYPAVGHSMRYKLFTPARDTSEPAPLLVMLHGCTQDAQDFATATAMNTVAQQSGFYVLYPTQEISANVNRCWNWFEPEHQARGSGEPASISGLTQQIIETHPIDSTRVFVAGLSAGGAMALIMAEQYPEVYAAVGVHSGLPTGAASSMSEALMVMSSSPSNQAISPAASAPSGHLLPKMPFRGFSVIDGQTTKKKTERRAAAPMIVFQGAMDRIVNPGNADRIVKDWLACKTKGEGQSGCGSTTDTVSMPSGHGYSVTRYTAKSEDRLARCEHWVLTSGGHQWSGGNAAGSHADDQGPDASAEMVRFFMSVSQP